MSKKLRTVLSIIMVCAMVFMAACGSDADEENSNSDNSETNSETGDSEQQVVIKFEQFNATGDNEQVMLDMIAAYEEENPHVTIDHQSFGYDDYFTQLMAKLSGGQAPDVFELNYENFISYAKKGALMPLNDILEAGSIDTSVYNDTALQAFAVDGEQYAVPNSFSNVVLVYNKDLFDKAGADYPTDDWTWEDAMEAAVLIRTLDDDIYGYYHPLSYHEFFKVVQQNGGSLLSEDGSEFTMDTPENVETLEYMVNMQNDTNVMPTSVQLERTANADWDLFKSGRLGMIVTGIWSFPDFTADCDFEWDVAVEPGNKTKATHFFSNAYAVSGDSEVAEEATNL